MSNELDRPQVQFEPIRPASRGQVIAAIVLGPILWLVALIAAAWLFDYSLAIALGLLVTVASFLVSLAALTLLRARRQRQERRYADGR